MPDCPESKQQIHAKSEHKRHTSGAIIIKTPVLGVDPIIRLDFSLGGNISLKVAILKINKSHSFPIC